MAQTPEPVDEKQWMLSRMAQEFGIELPEPTTPVSKPPITPPPMTPQFKNANDEVMADELLKRRRTSGTLSQNGNGGGGGGGGGGGIMKKRSLTLTRKDSFASQEIFDALDAHVENHGSPGVAEALIYKLRVAGGDLNSPATKSKMPFHLKRRNSYGPPQTQSRILKTAVENGQWEMVAVLVRHADAATIDAALLLAIEKGNYRITETLLSYGANLTSSETGKFVFQQLCFNGEHPELVGLLLRSEGRPLPEWISGAMVIAAEKGHVETVVQLSMSIADGSYDGASALKTAIRMCRVDIALAILIGEKPPTKEQVTEAFQLVFEHPTVMPPKKRQLANILLLAGAEGDVVSQALIQACDTEFYEMIDLLLENGASVEFEDASAIATAIQRGNIGLIEVLLREGVTLSPHVAAELILSIPKRTDPEHRRIILKMLLRKGADGPALDDALIDAVENVDFRCVEFLVSSKFSGTGKLQPPTSHDLKRGPRNVVFEKHATANVNHKGGLALSLAVKSGNVPIVKLILEAQPNVEILTGIFPEIQQLERKARYEITKAFLAAGVSGPGVGDALQHAIEEHPPRRDSQLISILLQHDVDVNNNKAAPTLAAIEHVDVNLLQALLRKRPMTPRNATIAFVRAMSVENKNARQKMVGLLLTAGADVEVQAVGEAMLAALHEEPTDLGLLDCLLVHGKVDINQNYGSATAPMSLAVLNSDPDVLEIILRATKPTPETMDLAVLAMSKVPSTRLKAVKLESILKRTKQKETLNRLLGDEVTAILECPTDQRSLVVLKSLLSAGVDVNAYNGMALSRAVAGGSSVITDLILTAKPSVASLNAALPQAVMIQDQAERLTFTQKLLHAGASPRDINDALIFAIKKYPADFALINTLVINADTSDGSALSEAVKGRNVVLLELVLARSKRHTAASLNDSFEKASSIQDREIRKMMCELLLKAGAKGPVVSEALLAAAGTGDLTLGAMLLNHGANVDHQEGQAVVEACRSGSPEILQMLLTSKADVKKDTLERGFQAATEIGDLKQRAGVFRLLLEAGVSGEAVDAQLVSAARYGEDALELVELLLYFGASTDFENGEAIYNATRCAFLGILEVLLGVSSAGGKQRKPSSQTLTRALRASSKLSGAPRYQVVRWLFAVGLPVQDDVHLALEESVIGEEKSVDLVRLLLENGASPTANGCKCLIDAAQRLDLSILDLLLQGDISREDANRVFVHSFIPAAAEKWLSEPGLQVAKHLIERGADGEALSDALGVALDYMGTAVDQIAQRFVGLLIQHNANINSGQGQALVKAAKIANAPLIEQMLQQRPDAETLSMAFPYVFDHGLEEVELMELIALFTNYRDGETRLDPLFQHPDSDPVVFKALSMYPRSTKIIQTLFDAGYYHDQMTNARILDEIEEEEQVNLLIWCLLQPQKRVSSGVITMLIDQGAKINFETRLSKMTPLMLAIREKRQDIVKQLLLAGAEVDIMDATGNTPLTLTTQIGGDLGTLMMANILAAEPSQNDGSLHNAARDLNIQALQILVEFGHEVDFPSSLHGGRSALGELCLHAADAGPLTMAKEKTMEKAMSFLLKQNTDLELLSDGKSVLLLAMESADPIATIKALLKVGMWKHINKSWNYYTDGTYTYSPSQYARRVLKAADTTEQLLTLLKANRAQDVYYANEGAQPEDAIGLPEDIVRVERERKARLERIRLETEDHARTLARTKEVAAMQDAIFAQRAQLEDHRSRQKQMTEIDGIREKAAIEESLFNDAIRRQRAERAAVMEHQSSLTQAEVERRRLVAETDLDAEKSRQQLLLQYETRVGDFKVDHAKQMSAVRKLEREDIDGFEKEQDLRHKNRLIQERKLIEQQQAAAQSMAALGIPQRKQIGYVAGELD